MLNLRVSLTAAFTLGYTLIPTTDMLLVADQLNQLYNKDWRKLIVNGFSSAYGYTIASIHTRALYNDFMTELSKENYDAAEEHLISCHIISSTIKAITSTLIF